MPLPTDIETFQTQTQSIPEIKTLLDRATQAAEFEEATDATRCEPTTLTVSLSLVAAAALWKLLSVGIDTLRNMTEDAALQRRIHLVRELQDMGYDRQAPSILSHLLQDLRNRPDNDPVLKKLIELFH